MRISLLSSIVLSVAALAAAQSDAANGIIDKGPFPEELNGSNFTYPFPVEVFRFNNQFQDLEMVFMDVKPTHSSNGRTAVLLHGKNFCAPTWVETIQTLTYHGFRVVAVDQLGFCKSSKPENYQFSLRQLAHNTRGLLNALDVGNVTVIGHSLGGMLTTTFGLQYPETIDKMVLVDPIGLEDYSAKGVPYITIDASEETEAASTFDSIKDYEKQFYYVDQWNSTYDIWVDMLVNIYNGPKRDQFVKNQAQIVDLVLTQPVAQYFKDLKPRTLLIVGDKDKTAIGAQWAPKEIAATLGHFRVLGPQVASQIPNSDFIHFSGLGHAPQISDPGEFHTKLLTWLLQ